MSTSSSSPDSFDHEKFVTEQLKENLPQLEEMARLLASEVSKHIEEALKNEKLEPLNSRENIIVGAIVGTISTYGMITAMTTMSNMFESRLKAIKESVVK